MKKESLPQTQEAVTDPRIFDVICEYLNGCCHNSLLSISPLNRGGNNRSYDMRIGTDRYFLKAYFFNSRETHNRLHAEYQFLLWCARCKLSFVPRALVCDAHRGLALYQWIEGVPLSKDTLTCRDWEHAANFLQNLAHASSQMHDFARAKDACFCLADHVQLAKDRLAALRSSLEIHGQQRLASTVKEFLVRYVNLALEEATARCLEQAPVLAIMAEPFVSPSDFGFHNALRTSNGLCYVDFEYAGWDTPEKALCDFLCQPAIPVPLECLPTMAGAFASTPNELEALISRVRLLLPLHRIKWFCIMLNEFKENDFVRRKFAKEHTVPCLEEQWEKAKQYCFDHVLI